MRLPIACLLLTTVAFPALAANRSTYTDLKTDACTVLSEMEEGGSISLRCDGYEGYPVYFKEGDLRQSLSFGEVDQSYIDDAFESFAPFNSAGEKLEWRLDGAGTPLATILRWFVSDPGDDGEGATAKIQVLVISTVAKPENRSSCVVGYVYASANPDANEIARRVADEEARTFRCGIDEPQFHGRVGAVDVHPSRFLPGMGE